METFFLLRHGETTWNKNGRVMGRLEVPLNRTGIAQARHVVKLAAHLDIDAIYSSPLKRSLQTARILAQGMKVPVKIDPQLTEVAFGRWEGYQFQQLIRDQAYHRFLKTPLTAKVPGGETMRDVQKRGIEALRRAARKYPQGRILFVTHGDVIRAILCHHLRLPLAEFRRLRIDNGSLTALEVNGPWAECKFINYLPDVIRVSHKPYAGLDPLLLKEEGATVQGVKGNEKTTGRQRA
ncbi:MAG: histidine phosphatase family protein [Deltaproteobacteria bacterium]|nr:histidine phosphatase family protein [Deltaproteobacteria bacterium]